MAILRNTFIFLLPLLLAGCYSDFDPKVDVKPVLCLNSLITAGEPIEVSVTHTWVYTDADASIDHKVTDANVRIYVNGMLVEADYLPKEGDSIRIEASSSRFGHAEAEVTVPRATLPSDIKYDFTVRSSYADFTPGWGLTGRMLFDINVTLNVPASQKKDCYYRLGYQSFTIPEDDYVYTDPDYTWDYDKDYTKIPNQSFSKGNFITPDPIFSEYVSDFEKILEYSEVYDAAFFADHSFEDSFRPVHFKFEGCGYSVSGLLPEDPVIECGYHVTLYSISKSYFDWAMYYWQNFDGLLGEFSDMGLADPIWGYSNVSTGAGVVAAQSSTTVTIDLREFLQETLKEAEKQ